MEHVKAMLQKSSGKLKGKIVDNHVVLDITGDAVHYWSPQLSFRIEPDFFTFCRDGRFFHRFLRCFKNDARERILLDLGVSNCHFIHALGFSDQQIRRTPRQRPNRNPEIFCTGSGAGWIDSL
jgi:hypothetical protein